MIINIIRIIIRIRIIIKIEPAFSISRMSILRVKNLSQDCFIGDFDPFGGETLRRKIKTSDQFTGGDISIY